MLTLPIDEILDLSNFKDFAEGKKKKKMPLKMNFVMGRVENIVGKGENGRKCWLPAFSPFPTIFSKGLFVRVVKSRDCVLKG